MLPGMVVRSFRGQDGKIVVPGLGAVVATFSSWTLRREDDSRAGPRWHLHAVLSYQNETLIKRPGLTMKIVCVLTKEQKFELCSYDSFRIEGASLIVEGVVQCQ